jgi:hypothetical protein
LLIFGRAILVFSDFLFKVQTRPRKKRKREKGKERKVGVVVLLASREWKAGSAGNQNKKKIGKIMKHRWRKGLP